MDLARKGQPVSADLINGLIRNAQARMLPDTPGQTDAFGQYQPTRVEIPDPVQSVLNIKIEQCSTRSGQYDSGYSGVIDSGVMYDASYKELISSGFGMDMITQSGIYNNYIMREVCSNPTSLNADQLAVLGENTTSVVQYVYKATASVAPVTVLPPDSGDMKGTEAIPYRAAWKTWSLQNGNYASILNITDTNSGNIDVYNMVDADRYSEDFTLFTFASGHVESGYTSGSGSSASSFNTWAYRISDKWAINVPFVPKVSGLVTWDISGGYYRVEAATNEYMVYMATPGDDNNYAYGFSYPRLCDI